MKIEGNGIHFRLLRWLLASLLIMVSSGIHVTASDPGDPVFSDDQWVSMGGYAGTSGDVVALMYDDFGDLYVGGIFSHAGDVPANNIARWDGSRWSALGGGLNGEVAAIEQLGTDLYAGGSFTEADGIEVNGIARWDGQRWHAVGGGMTEEGVWVSCLDSDGSDLYVGGYFHGMGNVEVNHVAKWNGNVWSALGSGVPVFAPQFVSSIAARNGVVYVGGSFKFEGAGGEPVKNLARWDGNAWSSMGAAFDEALEVKSLFFVGSELHAGASILNPGWGNTNPTGKVARWDGDQWQVLGPEFAGSVGPVVSYGNGLLAFFSNFSQPEPHRLFVWNDGIWSVKAESSGIIRAIADAGGAFFVGGGFQEIGGTSASFVARHDEDGFQRLGDAPVGANAAVMAWATSGGSLYAGGHFSRLGSSSAGYLARWNGVAWEAVPNGPNASVHSLTSWGDDLYVGGAFMESDGSPGNGIARLEGASWHRVGAGVGGAAFNHVYDLAVWNGELYAGGNFTQAGGNAANYLAKWNGSTWTALESEIEVSQFNRVRSLAVASDGLYVGGRFAVAGGVTVNNIARWDGASWSALGQGVDDTVSDILFAGGNVYVGGQFSTAGAGTVNGIAGWSGVGWFPLGTGTDGGGVFSLFHHANRLYAAGDFEMIGGVRVNHVAGWDGFNWSALGSGVAREVGPLGTDPSFANALGVFDGKLFVGGSFKLAGRKLSPNLSAFFLNSPPKVEVVQTQGAAAVHFRGTSAGSHRIDRSSDLDVWETLSTRYSSETGGIDFVDPEAPEGGAFYRAVPNEP